MSMIYCEVCDKLIDTDFDAEHFDEHKITKEVDMSDYAHCHTCDAIINLDGDSWFTDDSYTYCELHEPYTSNDEVKV